MRVCYRKNILQFWLPPHISHLLQLLDVICLELFKYYHSKVIHEVIRDGNCEFLTRITCICLQTFKKNTIQESLRKTELIPFNPKIVMQIYKIYDLQALSLIYFLISSYQVDLLEKLFYYTHYYLHLYLICFCFYQPWLFFFISENYARKIY